MAPQYLQGMISAYIPAKGLRSQAKQLLRVPVSTSHREKEQCFNIIGPTLWNNLPTMMKTCTSLDKFKRLLKTHLFDEYFNNHHS